MPNPGIMLAAWPGSQHSLTIGKYFLKTYEEYFPDATIYIGINDGPFLEQWLEILKASNLNILYDITPKAITMNSDASAYQTALKLYKESGNVHDLIWFNHFKGASHAEHELQAYQFYSQTDGLMCNRHEIEQVFLDNDAVGLYALTGWPIHHDKLDIGHEDDFSSRYLTLPYSTLRITVVYTFYVARAKAIRYIVDNATVDFFEQPYPHRFFFEQDFYHMIFRQGYIPIIKIPYPGHGFTQQTFTTIIDKWKADNNL